MNKILIIHPKDATTYDFKQMYQNLSHSQVVTSHSKNRVRLALRDTDAKVIVFCGHGTQDGLLSPSVKQGNKLFDANNKRFLFDVSMLYLLKGKTVLFFWCYANVFTQRYNLKGFASGMFISDLNECSECCVNATGEQLNESNRLISDALKALVTHPQVETINHLEFILERYQSIDNPIVAFNRNEF